MEGQKAIVRRDKEGRANGQLGIVGDGYQIAQNEHLRAQLQKTAFEYCSDNGIISPQFLNGATLKETTIAMGPFPK